MYFRYNPGEVEETNLAKNDPPLFFSIENQVLIQKLESGGALSAQSPVEPLSSICFSFPRSSEQDIHQGGPKINSGRTAYSIGGSTQWNDPLITAQCQACALAQETGSFARNYRSSRPTTLQTSAIS